MTLSRSGGIAAMTCAVTYLVGFALLVTVLAPLGFGTSDIDTDAVAEFISEQTVVMLAWNTTIYIVNALALVVLVVSLSAQLAPHLPSWSAVARAIGLIWAGLVLGAGMIANVAVEQVARLYAEDPAAAADLWGILRNVELGLGGGNEIAGGVWILSVSVAGGMVNALPRVLASLGGLVGLCGLLTVIPALGDMAGAVFGLGSIAWFLGISWVLLAGREPTRELGAPA